METKEIKYAIILNKDTDYEMIDLKTNEYTIKEQKLYLNNDCLGKVVRLSHSLELAEDILSNLKMDHENAKRYIMENENDK